MENSLSFYQQQSTAKTTATTTATTTSTITATKSTTKTPKDTQISFEIPTHRDLQHIESLQKQRQLKYSRLLGNVPYDTISTSRDHAKTMPTLPPKSVVLNVVDHSEDVSTSTSSTISPNSGLDRMFFGDADMHTFINILWIGVVSALIVLSIVFIVLSVYFYRKFRVWKQCHRENYTAASAATVASSSVANNAQLFFAMPYNAGNISTATFPVNGTDNMSNWSAGSVLCNVPPPCYTIATGLPTYAQALNRQIYGTEFICPTPHLFEHQQLQMQQQLQYITSNSVESINERQHDIQVQQQPQQQYERVNDKVFHHHDIESSSTSTAIHYIKPIFTMESSMESKDVVIPLLENSTSAYAKKDDVFIV